MRMRGLEPPRVDRERREGRPHPPVSGQEDQANTERTFVHRPDSPAIQKRSQAGERDAPVDLPIVGEGVHVPSLPMLEESVERFREIGDDHRVLVVTGDLAVVHKLRGDREGARALLEDVLRQARASGDAYMEATALDDLAEYALDEGRIDDGLSLLRQSIRMSTRLTRAVRIQENLLRFAYAFAAQKKPEVAASLLSFSTTRIEQTQSVAPYGVAYTAEMKEKTLTLIRGQLEDAALAEAWQQGRTLTEEEALALALNSND